MGYRIRPTVITFESGVTPQALDLANSISFNVGTDYWRIKWKGKLHETRTGIYGLFGGNATSTNNGFAFNFATAGNGLFNLNRGGSLVLASNSSYIIRDSSRDYVYEVEHLETGELYFRRDDAVHQQSTYTSSATFSGSQALNSLFRRTTIPSTGVVDLELEYIELQFGTGPTRRWSGKDIISPANRLVREGGDGSDDLIQTATWPTNNTEWIYYDSSTNIPVTFNGNIPNIAVSIDQSVNIGLSSYFSGNITPFTFSVFSGSLPTGLSLSPGSGTIIGIPTSLSTNSVVIQATDSSSNTANSNSFDIVVNNAVGFDGTGFEQSAFEASSEIVNIVRRPAFEISAFETEAFESVSSVAPTSSLKRWDGTAWVPVILKRWDGTSWVEVTIKRYNGSAWGLV